MAAAYRPEYLRQFEEETEWYNEILLSAAVPGDWWRGLPHPLRSWMRNCIGGYIVYFISGFLWCYFIYHWKRHAYIPKDSIPTVEAMKKQIIVASKAMPFYSALPTISEHMIESGWTRCFFNISEIGWPMYLIYVALYLIIVEFGIYWMHRELHDIKPLYKYLHATHHIYNKENTLSPFAGLAFHPLDGILQAIPHVFALFVVPTHFRRASSPTRARQRDGMEETAAGLRLGTATHPTRAEAATRTRRSGAEADRTGTGAQRRRVGRGATTRRRGGGALAEAQRRGGAEAARARARGRRGGARTGG